ncbi:MAG: acetyl-CoA carboxylase carboxyltransferase subunit beta, partial [Acidaminobacteraceae bacterium]
MLEKLFKKTKYISLNSISEKTIVDGYKSPNIPDGMYIRCKKCDNPIYKDDLESSNYICNKCSYHFRLKPIERINIIADVGSFVHYFEEITSLNPLDFEGYEEKVDLAAKKNQVTEAVTTGVCTIDGMKVALGVMDPSFMMGSMGSVVGERLTLLIEKATADEMPLIIIAASGGARMQEGIFSLMQMAKTSMAIKKHSKKGNLYISILTDPTTGGVT